MSEKEKPSTKPQQLTEEETSKVVGGIFTRPGGTSGVGGNLMDSPESCKATPDTGMMGCPG